MNSFTVELTRVKAPDQELLELLADQSRKLPLPVLIVLGLVAAVIYPLDPTWVVAWFSVVVVVLWLRYSVLTRLPLAANQSTSHRVWFAAGLSLINGVTHAASLFWFSDLSETDRVLQSLILAGLATAAITTTNGDRRVYSAYVIPIMPTLGILWCVHGGGESSPDALLPVSNGVLVGLGIGVFTAVLVMLAREAESKFVESIEIRRQQESLNEQLTNALHDAEVADRAKTRFLASASHDLRQPIHALSLFGASLKMQALPASASEIVDHIDESIGVLASQFDALLDISRLDAGAVTPDIQSLDLSAMLKRIGRDVTGQSADKGLSMHLDVTTTSRVRADKLLLERVIRNLLSNAIRYTERGGILLTAHDEGGQCSVVIADTGVGIAEDEQKKIFSEFYQVEQGRQQSSQGLGLGLSIVSRLLSLMNIPLEFSSTPGEGTRFEMSLDIDLDSPGEDMTFANRQILSGLRVLMIDDDVAVRAAMAMLLRNYGADVMTAGTVDDACASAQTSVPDLVLSDLRLGMGDTGIDAIGRIHDAHPSVPAILLTGDTSPEHIRLADEAGIELLHKPVSIEELERRVAQVLGYPG
ncbi:MAG: hybrid sensor histidine kinase/response regulator [Pseudomonadota bacterium]